MADQTQNQGQQPAQQPALQPAAQPIQTAAPNQPTAPQTAASPAAPPQQTVAAKPAAPTQTLAKSGTPLPKDTSKSNKKFVIGCLGAVGCSLLLFIVALFGFLAFGSANNPIFSFLGSTPGEVVNVMITLTNFIFLFLVFIAFILVVIGIFKITTAKKDDKEAKKSGAMFTLISTSVLIVLILIWIVAYFFLAGRRTPIVRTPITTVPANTINLTAPIAIQFDASKAPINRTQFDILSYSWDFGDKKPVSGVRQSHTFTEIGNYNVQLTITLKEKTTAKESTVQFARTVTIQNVLANVVIKADKTSGGAPLTVNLDGSDSSSPNGEITEYAWDLDEDGVYDDGASETAQATLTRVGSYKIGLRVTDSTGTPATGELEIEVTAPDNPVAVIKVEGLGSSTELEVGKAYIFSAADSISPAGTIERYAWDFGDNKKSQTRTATHTYEQAGDYDVTLTITDSQRKRGETTQRFTVKAPAAAPLAAIRTTPEAIDNIVSGQAPFNVIFDASQSQDQNDNIVEYAWDFEADSRTDDTNAVTSHTFSNPGTYNVRLTVTDSTNLSANAQTVIRVESPGLNAEITAEPISGVVPLTVNFDASGSTYPDGRIVSYEWDFGEGNPPRTDTSRVSYRYTSVGTFNAKVTAITSDNRRDTAEIPINVRAVPVKACFEPTVRNGTAPLEVEFDPTCSTGTVMRYRWNFANLSQSTDRKPKYTFRNPGEYNISLEVADSENVVDTFSLRITVTAAR